MRTEKARICNILQQAPKGLYPLTEAAHLPLRKVNNLLEELSKDGIIEFVAGVYRLKEQSKDAPVSETIRQDFPKLEANAQLVENIKRRDYSRFKIGEDGPEVGKARLVLEIIKTIALERPNITLLELKELFPDKLHPKFGVVQALPEAIKKSEKHNRFFIKDPIKTGRSQIAVCREWSKDNIAPLIERAISLGIKVMPVTS